MLGPVFYLAGDSFSGHCPLEDALRGRIGASFAGWTGQAELHARQGAAMLDKNVPRRLDAFEKTALGMGLGSDIILIARSSGARVATMFSLRHDVAAVICLSYPFQPPGKPPEPKRFAHLATVQTPTLIVQGTRDIYGGADIRGRYDLSSAITLRFVDGTHALATSLRPAGLDLLAEAILSFCQPAESRSGALSVRPVPSAAAAAGRPVRPRNSPRCAAPARP